MRTISILYLGTLLLFSLPYGASAQQFSADTLIPPSTYAIPKAPFVAVVEETRTPEQPGHAVIHRRVRVLRDSEGRQRYEDLGGTACPGCASGATNIRIYDVVGHRFIRLDPTTMTATVLPMESTSPPVLVPASGLPLSDRRQIDSSPVTDPVKRKIAGLQATLTRTTRQVSTEQTGNAQPILVVDELWTSPLYRMPLMHVVDDPRYGRTVLQVVRFEAREPEASLFDMPPGYRMQSDHVPSADAAAGPQ